MLFCGLTGHCLWPLFHKDRSAPSPVAPPVLGHIGKIHPHSQWWTWPWTWGKCSRAQVTEGWPLYSFLPGAPLVSEGWPPIACPVPNCAEGEVVRGPVSGHQGGGSSPGSGCLCSDLLPGVRPGGRRQQQKGSVFHPCPRLGRACWPEMSIRWRDADPCRDAGLLGFRDKNALLPGLRPVAGKYWELNVWHKGLQVSYFSGGTFLSR